MKERRWIRGEHGLQTLEWVALGLVILALVAAVAFWLTYQASESTGRAVMETIEALFECVQRLDFDCAREVWGTGGGTSGKGVEGPRDIGWCVTHPLDCWREVIWPSIQQGAKWVWDRLVEVGRAIQQGVVRVWDWLKKQWDVWLKGALAGLLAAVLVIVGIILLVKAGVVAIGVAIVAGIVVLIVGLIVGIGSQLLDPQGGFWKYFMNALTACIIAAGLVISGWTAIAQNLLRKWLASGLVPAIVSFFIELFGKSNEIFNAIREGSWSDLGRLTGELVIIFAMSYLTGLATWGITPKIIEIFRIRVMRIAISPNFIKISYMKMTTIVLSLQNLFSPSWLLVGLINISGMYWTGILTGVRPKPEEYIVVLTFSIMLSPFFEAMKNIGINEWIIESISQISQKLLSWIASLTSR